MMQKIKEEYAKAIVNDLLGLRAADGLSINTEDNDFEFAKLVANEALAVTHSTVKVVVTEGGRPIQVMDFDPEFPGMDAKSFVMLRLAHERKKVFEGPTLDVILDPNDMIAVQRFGHLADPIVLNRRISVPWCVAKVYDDSDEEAWAAIHTKINLNIPSQSLSAVYRSKALENGDLCEMTFTSGEDCFTFGVPQGNLFVSGHQVLRSGREFLTSMDFDRISFIADRNVANGSLSAEVEVLGKTQQIHMVFEKGLLVDWTHTKELDQLLGFDENLRRVGYVSIRDNEFVIYLGGSITEALGVVPEDEENLPDYFNTSLYTIKCRLPKATDIVCTSANGICRQLADKGMLID